MNYDANAEYFTQTGSQRGKKKLMLSDAKRCKHITSPAVGKGGDSPY